MMVLGDMGWPWLSLALLVCHFVVDESKASLQDEVTDLVNLKSLSLCASACSIMHDLLISVLNISAMFHTGQIHPIYLFCCIFQRHS